MKYTIYKSSIEIKTKTSKESLSCLEASLEEDFKKVSKEVSKKGKKKLKVKHIITARPGSDFCKNTTTITIKKNASKDGYFIESETNYKKIVWFDILCAIITLGLYVEAYYCMMLSSIFFITGWFFLCRFLSAYAYRKNETELKNIVETILNKTKHRIENGTI